MSFNIGRLPSRPLSYDKINGITNFKGEFNSINSLPSTNVYEGDYAIVNKKCYKYNSNNEWEQMPDIEHITPIQKEVIVDYNKNIIYICDENRNILKASSSIEEINNSIKEYIDGHHRICTFQLSSNMWNWKSEVGYVLKLYSRDFEFIEDEIDSIEAELILSHNKNAGYIADEINEYNKIYNISLSSDNTVVFYAFDEPNMELNLSIRVNMKKE